MMIIANENGSKMKPKVLVHFHLYYHNQLNFMLKKLANICNCDWDLFVTACEINKNIIQKIKAFKADARILQVENKGYDIWPFIQVLNKVNLDDYDFILKTHTKNYRRNFEYFGFGYSWRNFLINGILKNKKLFAKNLKLMSENPSIGMITSEAVLVPMGNKDSEDNSLFKTVCQKYNLQIDRGNFVAGTMFIAKADCFNVIKNMHLTEEDFCHKQITSGKQTVAHVLERLLSRVVEMHDYTIYTNPDIKYRFYKNFKEFLKNIFAIRNEIINNKKYKEVRILGKKFYFA